MAETAILAALKVLGATLADEVMSLATSKISKLRSTYANLEVNMNNISTELQVMQGFLNDIETEHPSNESQVAWIKEVQKLANHIEDIVVEFAYLIGNQKFGGISFYVKKTFKEPKLLIDFKRIASELLKAEERLKNLARMKERWLPTIETKNEKNSNFSNKYSHNVAVSAHFVDEDHLVGITEDRVKLMKWLNFREPQLSIVSVWGMGGVGKTTLVTNVFKRERKNFDRHAWVTISHSYTIENILQNIISEICRDEKGVSIDVTNMDILRLKKTLQNLLEENKYLIVLDDMWDPKAFLDIRDTLVDNHRGSKIVITSRMVEVANLAPENNRLELKPLSETYSWSLFCRKAFPREKNHTCPPLEKWARKIASKCDGLPLAIVSLGVMLSLLEKTEFEWRRLYDQLSWQLENNPSLDPLKSILNLSFKYLPKYLKNCFLYCSLFPEDFVFSRKKLLRLWIAEGFIEQKGRSTLEEVAEGYLIELINRSMLQEVQKDNFGRLKRCCQMHDTVRELAISLCRKENYGLLHEDNQSENADSSTRRLSIINLRETVKLDVCLPKLRTFLSVDNDVPSSPLLSLIFDKSRYLTVLDLEGLPIETVPNAIGDLFNLHYLGLRKTKVKFLPKSIKKLHNLQTLDLYISQIQKLPDGITELKKLRHLYAEVVVDPTYRSVRARTGISLPKGMFYLKDLQTIQALESNDMVVRELANLTQLRSFRIRNVKENHSIDLCRSLSKMSFLSTLCIFASDEKEILQLECLNLPQLQKLNLKGKLNETILESPLFRISGNSIQTLWLGWSQLQNDPLQSLSHCRNLTYLNLQRAYEGQQLNFLAGWLPKLKSMELRLMPNLIQVEMQQGTMASLEEVYLWELERLVEVPRGMEHLVSLKRMSCINMPVNFGGLAMGTHRLFHFTCHVHTWQPTQ